MQNVGTWKLVQAFHKVEGLAILRRKHNTIQKRLPASKRTIFVVPKDLVAENARYIVWKDCKVVVF